MVNIYDSLVSALSAHWKAHDSRYPQKVVLSPAQHEELTRLRKLGRVAIGDKGAIDPDNFMGVRLEQDPASPGMLIAADGAQTALG